MKSFDIEKDRDNTKVLDQLIEKRASLTINEIFTKNGEESFRVFEKQLLIEVSLSENTVVAVGGGTPCYFSNMEIMNPKGSL